MAETPAKTWDCETDPDNPQPQVWPECAFVGKDDVVCGVAWVWKRAFSFSEGYKWYWMKDCKHKTGGHRIMTKEGPIEDGQ